MLNQSKYLENLPLVLLGLCTAVKDDAQCLSAEIVYSNTLQLLGYFFFPSPQKDHDFTPFFDRLTAKMAYLTYCVLHSVKSRHVCPNSLNCVLVFVHDSSKVYSLQPLCRGPFKTLKKNNILLCVLRI